MAGSPEPEPEAEAEPGKTGIGNVLQQVECFLVFSKQPGINLNGISGRVYL